MAHHQDIINRVSMLPVELKRNLTYLRELDQQFQELQKQYEKQCIKELETAKKVAESGNIPPNALHFSDDVGSMNKACDDVAEKKVALAQKTYDLVDSQIRKLDKCLKKFDEQLKKEREQTLSLEASEQATDNLGQDQKNVDNSKPNRKKAQALVQPVNMDLDLPIDPNEPTYCYCNRVSFGEMIACDNPNCRIEWFHFDCVGLKEQPKGKWYCPDCASFSKRRRRK